MPAPVAALVGQMLAKEPSGRPASARLVADRASALRDKSLAGENAWAAGSAERTGPAAWFPEASPTSPELRHAGTAPIPAAVPRRPRSRRPAALMITTGAVGAVAAAAVIALMAANKHPATASTTVPTTSAPAHHTHRPARKASPQPSFPSQSVPATPAAPRPSTSSRHPSPAPYRYHADRAEFAAELADQSEHVAPHIPVDHAADHVTAAEHLRPPAERDRDGGTRPTGSKYEDAGQVGKCEI